MALPEGVDVSHHNGKIDWDKARNAGISFALIKATEGRTFTDKRAEFNRARCHEVGIVPGMYHFYRHDVDPASQAAHFLQNIGRMEPGELPPTIDVEAPGDGGGPINHSTTETVHRIGIFVNAIRSALGRSPMIYTYPFAWKEVTKNSKAFSDTCPLWIASYGVAQPKLIGGWTKYTVWQYTDQGTVDGIGSGVDRNRFNGDLADLKAAAAGPLEVGRKARINQDANVRAGSGLSAELVRVLREGTVVTIVEGPQVANGRNWWKIDDGAGRLGWCSSKVLTSA